jgi:hypothetical protein
LCFGAVVVVVVVGVGGVGVVVVARLLSAGHLPVAPRLVESLAASTGSMGLATAASRVRVANRPNLVSTDRKTIPDKKVFIRTLSCAQAHPGLCSTRDSDVYVRAIQFAKNIECSLPPDLVGCFFR